MRGFRDDQARGIGRFVDRGEIEDRNPHRVSDLFRDMAGVRVGTQGGGGHSGFLRMRKGGEPRDLHRRGPRQRTGAPIDDYVSAQDLEAVEAYNASETPPLFSRGNCGGVVMWARQPGTDGDGRPWSWRRAFVAVGIATGILVLR